MPRPLTRARSCVALCAAVACGMMLCAGCSGTLPVGSASVRQAGRCVIPTAAMMTPHDMPGFAEISRITHAPLPGSHGIGGHPRWDITQYVCGQSYEFISDVIMHGRYRAGDDALARSLGYPVGEIPLLPYEGPAVSQLPHGVFQADEEVFQFRSAKAAGTWLTDGRWSPTPWHALAGLPLPSGFLAIPGVAGPDNGRDQHGIGISGQRGNLVIVVSFNGGKDLAWADVKTIWAHAYTHLAKTLLKS
jgi:hypothetical protein